MWKIHRYYLKEVSISAVLTFVVLFGIVLISLIARGIQRAQGADLASAGLIVIFFALDTFPHLLTISLLFATVLTFARASQDREITALRSAGISPRVPLVASLIVGLLFALVGSFFLHYLIPQAHFRKYRVVAAAAQNLVMNQSLDSDRIPLMDEGVMEWQGRDADGSFRNVTIYRKRDGKRDSDSLFSASVWTVEKAWFVQENEGLILKMRGLRDPLIRDSYLGELTVRINIRALTEQGRRRENERDIPSDQLLSEVYRGVHDDSEQAEYTVYRRSCFALMPALFAPLGFCIGVLARDRGRMTALTFSLVPLGMFYLLDFMAAELVSTFSEPLLAWLPAAAISAIGIPVCWKLLRV